MKIFYSALSFLHKKTLLKPLFLIVLISLIFIPALNTHAQFADGFKEAYYEGNQAGIPSEEFGGTNLVNIIIRAAELIFSLVATIALFAIIWGGVMYILALGDEARITKAKRILLFAILGLIIVSLADVIVGVVVCTILGPLTREAGTILYNTGVACVEVSVANLIATIIRIIQFLMAPAAVIAFGALVIGGYMYIISGGDEAKTGKAKRIILFSFIGLAIIGASGLLVNTVLNLVI
jgi:hypothetical protein